MSKSGLISCYLWCSLSSKLNGSDHSRPPFLFFRKSSQPMLMRLKMMVKLAKILGRDSAPSSSSSSSSSKRRPRRVIDTRAKPPAKVRQARILNKWVPPSLDHCLPTLPDHRAQDTGLPGFRHLVHPKHIRSLRFLRYINKWVLWWMRVQEAVLGAENAEYQSPSGNVGACWRDNATEEWTESWRK